MGIPFEFPTMVRIYSIGAMFMAENASSGVRTRHIDTILCEEVFNIQIQYRLKPINHQDMGYV
jgi:hypothetical protein